MDEWEDTEQDIIDDAIAHIETCWIEYSNGSKTAEEAQEWQRFIIRDLLEKINR